MIKKILCIVILIVFLLAGCVMKNAGHSYMNAEIIEIYDGTLLIHRVNDLVDNTLTVGTESLTSDADQLQIGDQIIIEYDGEIIESDPGQFKKVYSIEKK